MSESTIEPLRDTPSAGRLVIRVKLISPEPQQLPTPRRWKGPVLLMLGIGATLLIWLGVRTFGVHPDHSPATAEQASSPRSESATPSSAPHATPPAAIEPRPMPATAEATPATPLENINEVIPEVPRDALATIRGTVRVSVRVTVDEHGTVVGTAMQDRGPSRYFARLATDASKKWTFAPAQSKRRQFLVQFNFTRSGVTARSNPPQ